MRLQEMYYIARGVLDSWVNLGADAINSSTSVSVNNLETIDGILSHLYQIDVLRPHIDSFRKINKGLESGSFNATLTPHEKAVADNLLNMLKARVSTIVDLGESLGIDAERKGFDIKLPPDMTLEDFSACTKDLEFVFTKCPIVKADGELIELSSVDIGSIWLTFAIAGGTVSILGGLAALVGKCLILRSHYLTCKQQEEVIKKSKKANELLDAIVTANKVVLDELRERAAEELSQKYDVTDPEDNEKLRRSLEFLSSWMSKGLEIYASIGTPDEVKAVFPPIEQQKLPDAATKMITDGKEQEK